MVVKTVLASLSLVFCTVIIEGNAQNLGGTVLEKAPEKISQEKEMKFYDQLRAEIKKSYDNMNTLVQKTHSGSTVPTKAEQKKVEEAKTGLEVKVILFRNFYQTPSVQSPKVREELLKLFKQPFINTDDLTKLKDLVAKERPKYI